MGYKNFIRVEKELDKEITNVLKGLSIHNEYHIDNAQKPEWNSALRKFGIKAKPLIEEKLLEPIWIHRTSNNNITGERLIRIPKDVKVDIIENEKHIIFHFKRRNIV